MRDFTVAARPYGRKLALKALESGCAEDVMAASAERRRPDPTWLLKADLRRAANIPKLGRI